MLALSPEEVHEGGYDEASAAVIDWHPPESFRQPPGVFDPELLTEARRR